MKSLNARFGLALIAKALIGTAAATAAATPVEPDFGGRKVLDLTAHPEAWATTLTLPVDVTIDASLEKPATCTRDDIAHGQLTWLADAALEAEDAILDASGAPIRRDGDVLVITPASGKPIVFTDWDQPATKTADGEWRRYAYVGQVAGLLRVEVQYGHDAPGSYLIDPADGDVSFVHNGGRVAVLDGDTLVTFEALNEPHRLVVATLGGDSAITLECRFDTRTSATGCGYVVPGEFALQWNEPTPIAMALRRSGDGWKLVADRDARALAATCRSAAR